MNTTAKRYAPSVLSFLVLVVGGLQATVATGAVTWVALAQFAVLVVTTATTWLVPLVDGPWRGRLKTGLELLGVVIVLVLPYIATGRITPAEALLVAVALIKAVGAQLGVLIRTDPVPPTAPIEVVDVTRPKPAGVPEIDLGPDHRAEPTT